MNTNQIESLEWLFVSEPLGTDNIDLDIEVMKDHPIGYNEYVPYALAHTCDNGHSVDVVLKSFNCHLLKWLERFNLYRSYLNNDSHDDHIVLDHAQKFIKCISIVADMYDGYDHEFIGRSLYIYDTSTSY